jgi:hypothetical protein
MTRKIMRPEIGFRFGDQERMLGTSETAHERFAQEVARDLIGGPVKEGRGQYRQPARLHRLRFRLDP